MIPRPLFPDRKVWSGGLVAIVTFMALSIADRTIGTGLTFEMEFAITIVVQFIWQYAIPPAWRDKIRVINQEIVNVVLANEGDVGAIQETKNPDDVIPKPNIVPVVLVALMFSALFAFSACAPGQMFGPSVVTAEQQKILDTPRARYVDMDYKYQGALATAQHLVRLGMIQGEDATRMKQLVQTASVALDQAGEASLTGSLNSQTYLSVANAAVIQLIQFLEEKKGATTP